MTLKHLRSGFTLWIYVLDLRSGLSLPNAFYEESRELKPGAKRLWISAYAKCAAEFIRAYWRSRISLMTNTFDMLAE